MRQAIASPFQRSFKTAPTEKPVVFPAISRAWDLAERRLATAHAERQAADRLRAEAAARMTVAYGLD